MGYKITEIIHGLSDFLKIQEKFKEHVEGTTELYEEMSKIIKMQENKTTEYNKKHSKEHHKHEMRIVKLETILETLFAMSPQGYTNIEQNTQQKTNTLINKED